jgi:catechol 2,3-dioxygenase-like lactoylglutathione lyase family enzyme
MKAVFTRAAPYGGDAMTLPVESVAAAISFYEETMGFRVVSRSDGPPKTVSLARDRVRIGLAENGGDPTQDGCFFEVDNLEAAFVEIKGSTPAASDFRVDKFGGQSYRVFFVVAPDGLCYMIGQRQE